MPKPKEGAIRESMTRVCFCARRQPCPHTFVVYRGMNHLSLMDFNQGNLRHTGIAYGKSSP